MDQEEQNTSENSNNSQESAQNAQKLPENYNPPNKISKKKQSDWVDKVVTDYKSSSTYVQTYWQSMWGDMRKMYNSERVMVGYNGISDTFVPMSYSIVEALVASTAGDKPNVEYIPTRPDQETNTEVLNHLYSYFWDLDGWTLKEISHARNLFKEGSAVKFAYWDIDHPCIHNIPIDDYFCDPTATFLNYQQAGYMGHRFLARKSALESEQIVDPATGDMIPKYMNLNKLTDRNDKDDTSKEDEDMHKGSVLDEEAQEDEVEVIAYFTLDEIVWVGNRQEVIYYDTNWIKARQQFLGYKNPTGMYPYIFDAFTPEVNQLYGRSILQPIMKPQELLNDLTNQNVDAVSWSLDPEMELDPMYSDYLDKIESATGNVYPFKPGSYVPVQKLPIPSSVFNERSNIKNEIREATGVDQMMMGALSTRVTAAEVKFMSSQATQKFQVVVSTLENGGYYQTAKLIYQLITHYVTEPVMLRVIGKNGVDWQKFDPNQFKGDYEPRVKLKTTLENEKQLKSRDLKEMYTALVGSPFVDQLQLEKFVTSQAWGLEPDEVEVLFKTKDQMAQDAQNAQQDKPQGKPPAELINYKDAPSDIQAQMEAAAGFRPSVTHETNMQSDLLSKTAGMHSDLHAIHQTLAPGAMPPGGGAIPPTAPNAGPQNINPAALATSGTGIGA